MKKNHLYILVLVAAFGLLVAAEYATPKPLNWTRSYSQDDKIPFGNYLAFNRLEDIFPNQTIINYQQTLYEYSQNDTLVGENFIFINDRFIADQLETETLMQQVFEEGSNVWIAAESFNGTLADTFKIDTYKSFFEDDPLNKDSLELYFTNTKLQSNAVYRYSQATVSNYFKLGKIANYEILSQNSYDSAVLLRIPHGKGAFYFHACPLAFTNYHLLSQNHANYISTAWSYLPLRAVVWDEYQKVGRAGARTPLRYILTVEPLKIAFWLSMIGLIIYTFFHAKRTQRPIPIIRPPQNDSLDFVKTLGQLYYQRQNHKNLAEKKIQYFYEHLRNQYYINEAPLSNEWKTKLVAKTNSQGEEVQKLLDLLARIQRSEQIDEATLQNLVQMMKKITS